ncbi:MAG: hypothetical protein WB820_16730 [Rhodoplanes sp.]
MIACWTMDRPTLGTSPIRVRASGTGTRPRAITAKARITKLAAPRKSRKVRSIFAPTQVRIITRRIGQLHPKATPRIPTHWLLLIRLPID